MKHVFFLFVCLACLWAGTTNAQTRKHTAFMVYVRDAQKPHVPLEDAYLYVLTDGDRLEAMVGTDSAGKDRVFLYNHTPTTKYSIRIEKKGYRMKTRPYRPGRDSVFFLKKTVEPALEPLHAYSWCSITEYGDYEPKPIRSWKDLPAPIQKKLKEHLLLKVGPELFPNLSVTGGQLVDIDRMHTIDPKTRDYRLTPYPYNVCVSYSDAAAGIGSYCGEVVLDGAGNIIEDP